MKFISPLSLVMILMLSPLNSWSQSKFIDGYVLTLTGDTLVGKIANNNYFQNALYCEFQSAKGSQTLQYLPGEITGYRFNKGKYYISKEVVKDSITKHFFMEYLLNGEMDIYFYQDREGGNNYFVSKDSIPLQELVYTENIREVDGKNMQYKSKTHQHILYAMTNDDPALQQKISSISKPTHRSLISVGEAYHDHICDDGACINYTKDVPRELILNLSGGANVALNDFVEHPSQVYPSLGFNLMFQQPGVSEFLFVGAGLYYEGFIEEIPQLVFRLPLSISRIKPHDGLSSIFSYELDLFTILGWSFKYGLKYQMGAFSVVLMGELRTYLIELDSGGVHLGMMLDLN